MEKLTRIFDRLFPEIKIYQAALSVRHQILCFLCLFGIFSIIGLFIPANGFIGFDWVSFFGKGNIPAFYPPWTKWVVSVLFWPTLIGLTLASVGVASLLRSRNILSVLCVFVSLPVMWTVFLGQLDGVVLLGLLGAPWLIPLALMKPQFAFFGLMAKRSYVIGVLATFLVSFMIWGLWPLQMFSVWSIHEEGKYVNDIAIGLVGTPLALILLWFSRGDMDMLMLAGSFMTPYLLPYSLIVVTPAIARLSPWKAVVACLLSWTPLSANWLGPVGWWLGWLFIAWLWLCLAFQRYPIRNTAASVVEHIFRKSTPPSYS